MISVEGIRRGWRRLFLAERPSIGLAFFRISAALTTGFYVLPTFFPLADNYLSGALKVVNTGFFPGWFIALVQSSSDGVVVFAAAVFCLAWFFFLTGLFTQISCLVMTGAGYYFYALNDLALGTLSWDILLVVLVLLCVTPYPGDYFSLDCLRPLNPVAFRKKRPFFIQRLLQLQIASIYFYTALSKITAEGNWLTANPVYFLMRLPPEGVTKFFLLRDFWGAHPGLCYVTGLIIVMCELAMPILLFCRKTRLSAIYLGFLFHLTLILTLDVPAVFFFLFPAQLLLFIPPEDLLAWIDRRRAINAGSQAWLVYDGKCGFCRQSIALLAVIDLFGCLRPVDYHTGQTQQIYPALTAGLAHSQLHLIESGGVIFGGFAAFRRLCQILPMLYPFLPIVYFPGSGIAGPVIYRWVARNRYGFHGNRVCEDNSCFREDEKQ